MERTGHHGPNYLVGFMGEDVVTLESISALEGVVSLYKFSLSFSPQVQ
jgi:hypothetical protein